MMYSEKYGFVAMLDVLGTTQCDIKMTKTLVRKIVYIHRQLEQFALEIAGESVLNGMPRMIAFSDIILFSWEVKDLRQWCESEDFKIRCFLGFTEWLRKTIYYGLRNGLLWRGAMSVGKYVEHSTILLGPAVFNVAKWYEKADWFGAIVTPSCQSCIGSVKAEVSMHSPVRLIVPQECFVEYEVPLKNDAKCDIEKKKMWAISWPYGFCNEEDPEDMLDQCFCNALISGIPPSKRSNSVEFFKYYDREVYPAIKRT